MNMATTTTLLPVVANAAGLQGYLSSIRRIPVLSAEEEYMLTTRFKKYGDLEAAKKLIASHLRLAAKVAFSYRFYGLPMEDIVSEANIGLMQAVKKFEPEKGTRLSTYAVWWIKAAINEFILKSWSLVRIGTVAAQKKLFYNLRKLKAKLGLYNDTALDDESVKSISKDLNVSENEVIEMDQRLNGDVSLNTPAHDEGYAERQDFIRADTDIEEELAERQENKARMNMLAGALNSLNDRERLIINARRLTENPETLDVLGERLGISRERVRQIENRAVEKMTAFVQKSAA